MPTIYLTNMGERLSLSDQIKTDLNHKIDQEIICMGGLRFYPGWIRKLTNNQPYPSPAAYFECNPIMLSYLLP